MTKRFSLAVIALFLLLNIAGTSYAQPSASVTGRVTDSLTGNPLPGANVSIDGTALTTETDLTGAFTLVRVPSGAQKLIVSYLGFEPKTVDIEVGTGNNQNLAIQLSSGIQESVTVNAPLLGYGELVPTAAKNTGETVLALPRGFEYNVLGKTGDRMSDGRLTPNEHDGMAAFAVGGKIRLIRNHEINDDIPKPNVAIGASNHYDEMAGGGTTTLVIDPKTRLIERDFVSLSGTLNNCAGGPTPWGTWISCEETTHGTTKYKDDDDEEVGGYAKPHGYCFEVSAAANTLQPATPLTAMGRFSHEAIAVDAKTGVVYLTEDAKPYCGFYRFIPTRPTRLAEGGTLQQLAIKGKPNYTTQFGQTVGTKFNAVWVTIDDPNTQKADTDEQAVFKQGARKGACHFNKLEGCWSDAKGKIYFVSSSGGDAGGGQIWTYEPKGKNGGVLTLLFESPDRNLLDMPDNICTDPNSPNLFMCEDSDYVGMGTSDNYVRILTPDGKVADFARNITQGFDESEVAGATFSPDGTTLFFNVQTPGFTVAVWGDWKAFKG